MIKKLIFISTTFILLFPVSTFTRAQVNPVYVEVNGLPEHLQLPRQYSVSGRSDTLSMLKNNQAILNILYEQGYITAHYHMQRFGQDSARVIFNTGNVFYLKRLKYGNLTEGMIRRAGIHPRHFENRVFSYQKTGELFNKILKMAENEGFPFATISMDSLELSNHEISASVNFNKGPFITFDSIKIEGNTKIKASFLAAFLQIKHGAPYNQSKIDAIEARILQLPFLELLSPPRLSFQNNEATVYLHLRERNSARMDGIVGFLPNENEPDKLLFTGQFLLDLSNLLGSAKALKMNWQRVNILSQTLQLRYSHPNILHSPFGIEAAFNLLKQDTTFLNRQLYLSTSFAKSNYSGFRIFLDNKASRYFGSQSEGQGDFGNTDASLFGMGYAYSKLNRAVFPTDGIKFGLEVSSGNKSFANTHQRFTREQVMQFEGRATVSYYKSIGKNLVVYQNLEVATIQSRTLFMNELFRVGGLNSLRGFNENFFFASDYAFLNNEIRFMFERESYFMLFYDQSLVSYELTGTSFKDFPMGFGAGFSLSTSNGIFNFIYALGRSEYHPLNFNLSKIHFGYVSMF